MGTCCRHHNIESFLLSSQKELQSDRFIDYICKTKFIFYVTSLNYNNILLYYVHFQGRTKFDQLFELVQLASLS